MSSRFRWICALSLVSSFTLAACGGSSGSSRGGQEPDYSALYEAIGLQPDSLPRAEIDEALHTAIPVGYLGFGTLMASLDIRRGLQPYESFLPQELAAVGALADEGSVDAPYPLRQSRVCARGGEAALFFWADEGGDGMLSSGEEVLFGFGDCVAGGVPLRFSSDGVEVEQPRVQSYTRLAVEGDEHLHHRFVLDQARLRLYEAFLVSGGPLVRHSENQDVFRMTFGNQAPVDEAPGSVMLAAQTHGVPVLLRLRGADDGVNAASIVRTSKPNDPELRFEYARIALALELGGEEARAYRLETDALDVIYHGAPLRIVAGSFRVIGPEGEIYTFAADPDPEYLYVTIDANGDGEVDASGRTPQAYVVNRLAPR